MDRTDLKKVIQLAKNMNWRIENYGLDKIVIKDNKLKLFDTTFKSDFVYFSVPFLIPKETTYLELNTYNLYNTQYYRYEFNNINVDELCYCLKNYKLMIKKSIVTKKLNEIEKDF